MIDTSLHILLKVPEYVPHDKKFDIMFLVCIFYHYLNYPWLYLILVVILFCFFADFNITNKFSGSQR